MGLDLLHAAPFAPLSSGQAPSTYQFAKPSFRDLSVDFPAMMATASSETSQHLPITEKQGVLELEAPVMVRQDSGYEESEPRQPECAHSAPPQSQALSNQKRSSSKSSQSRDRHAQALHMDPHTKANAQSRASSSRPCSRKTLSSRSSPRPKRSHRSLSHSASRTVTTHPTPSSAARRPSGIYGEGLSRMYSAPAGHMINPRQEDPMVLHQRSCSLFPSALHRNWSWYTQQQHPAQTQHTCSEPTSNGQNSRPSPSSPLAAPASQDTENTNLLERAPTPEVLIKPTVIHWTSPNTRRREYAEIDSRYTGFRGLCRRLAPKWCFRPSMQRFYDGTKDSDVSSVRRYRLELPEDEAEEVVMESREKDAPLGKLGARWSCWRRKRLRRFW